MVLIISIILVCILALLLSKLFFSIIKDIIRKELNNQTEQLLDYHKAVIE
jgi:phosphate/sulfate permease